MKQRNVRILSVLIALVMLVSVLSLTALADGVEVENFDQLKTAAQSAAEGATVIVSGNIAMTEPVTFSNKVTLKLTETANITYSSNNNDTISLITLQDGSDVYFSKGASISMIGDTENRTDARDWRVIRSLGTLKFTECEGSVTVTNAKGRAFYGTTDIVFECDMGADLKIDNSVGANRYVFAIYAQGDVVINGDLSGSIDVDFGGGNTAAGIYASSVTVNGDISGDIDVRLGTSHNAFGLYASGDITVTGDISGNIYARGASSNGYGIYASNDIAVAAISGSVTGDCYNEELANSQSGAGALYAGGSIYGSKDAEGTITPIDLTGTLSSTVGRSGAFTVQASEDVYIYLGSSAAIEAQSSYGAAWTELEGSYTGMEDNWGGTAVCVIANGDINLTGADENCTAVSQNENGEPVDAAGPLVATGNKDSVTRIDNFLCYVSLAALGDSYKQKAEQLNGQLTDADKALIDGYDEIAEDLFAETVNTKDELIAALNAANNGDIIVLDADIELDASGLPGAAIDGKKLTINGNGKTLTFTKSGSLTNGVFGNDTNPLYAGTDLTVKNLTIKNIGAQGGYAAILGYNAHDAKVTFEGCTFENLNAAVYVNAINADPEKGGVTLKITNCEYVDTPYGYAIDESAGSYLLTDVVFENNTGLSGSDEVARNVVYATVNGYKKVFSTIQAAVDAADDGSEIVVAPGTYEGNVSFGGKSLTIKAQYPAYYNGVKEADEDKLSKFTGTFNTSKGTNDSAFAANQTVVIEGFALSGDGLKIGNNNYNTVGNLEVRHCTMEFGQNLTQQENYNLYNYFVKLSGNAGAPYASVIVEDNYVSGTPDSLVTPIQLWDVDRAIVRNNVLELENAKDHQAINISKMAADAEVEVSGNVIKGAGGGIYVTTWLLDGETEDAKAKFTGSIAVKNNTLQCVDSDMDPIFLGYEDADNAPYGLLGGSISLSKNTNNGKNVEATIVFGPKGVDEEYFVVLVKDGKELVAQAVVEDGARYTLPAKPSKKGYTFLGWKSSVDREVYKAEATVKITRDTTFTAQWMSNWEIVDDIAGAAGSGKEFFTDVSVGDWYYEAVKFVFDNNFMDGVGDGKFNPDGTLTRAMIAQVLYNLEGETSSYPTVFDDVAKSAWYADAVNWAAASGIVEGKGNNKFDPNAAITRQEMAAILYRYSELKGYDVSKVDSLAAFTDANKVADWAKEAMGWAVENYVINGKGAGKLDPTGTATRAEVAQILMNLCNNVL